MGVFHSARGVKKPISGAIFGAIWTGLPLENALSVAFFTRGVVNRCANGKLLRMSDTTDQQPAIAPPAEPTIPMLSEVEARVLGEARLLLWKYQAVEYAYDSRVRRLSFRKTLIDYLGVFVAIFFLLLQYFATKENLPRAHDVLGYIGTLLSVLIILLFVWSLANRWTDQIEKKRHISELIGSLLSKYKAVTEARPLDLEEVRKWVAAWDQIEQERKHELASLPRYDLLRGYQHMANKNPKQGVQCAKCGKAWEPQMNKEVWKTHFSWLRCDGCGV
jgi:mobilome CxxCx(11)CxxC protein